MDDILVGFWKCKGYLHYAVPLNLAISLGLAVWRNHRDVKHLPRSRMAAEFLSFHPAVDISLESAPDCPIRNVTCLLYRVTDGMVWYGSAGGLTSRTVYNHKQYPFPMDETLYAAARGGVKPSERLNFH